MKIVVHIIPRRGSSSAELRRLGRAIASLFERVNCTRLHDPCVPLGVIRLLDGQRPHRELRLDLDLRHPVPPLDDAVVKDNRTLIAHVGRLLDGGESYSAPRRLTCCVQRSRPISSTTFGSTGSVRDAMPPEMP